MGLLQSNAGQPCLFQYSCDTTPVSSRKYLNQQHKSMKVRRSCKTTSEYFVQQVFVCIPQHDNEYCHTIIYRDPLPLQHGKTMKALLSAALRCPGLSLNGIGADVITIHHQCHDRAVTFEFVAGLSGWWSKQAALASATSGLASACFEDESLFEWHTWTGCAAHDGHNSLKWAHQGLFNDSNMLENCYVGVMAMRACFCHAVRFMADWLVSVLHPRLSEELPTKQDLYVVWCALGVDQDIAEVLSQMQLLWLDGQLVVAQSILDDSNWLQAISTCLLSIWRPPSFTTSRWCTVGGSCRGLLCGLMTGYPEFLKWMHRAGKIGDYDWHGCQRLDAKAWEFAAVVGLSSFVSDSFLAKILKDSRVARTQTSLREVLCNEFQFLDVLPQKLWDLLSAPLQMTAQVLRSSVISGAFISWSFLEWRVLSVASSLPWRLCAGDPEANLDEFLQRDEPDSNSLASKIWTLGRMGYNRARLLQAVHLLGQCSWTSAFTEKQHGSTSVIKKRHPDYGDDHLTARAFIHTFAQMLPSTSSCDLRRQQVVQKLIRTLDKNPNRITGRQVYLAHIMRKATEWEASKAHRPQYQRATIMKIHGKNWQALSDSSKQVWEQRAAVDRSQARQSRQQQCDTLTQQLHLLRETSDAAGSGGAFSSMLISQCRLAAGEIQRLQAMVQDSKLTVTDVARKRACALQCPAPLSQQESEECVERTLIDRTSSDDMPPMARRICQMRGHFVQAVFCIQHPDAARFYRFLFAMLNPVKLFLLELCDLECAQPTLVHSAACLDEQWRHAVPWQWSVLPGCFASSEVFLVPDNVEIGVFMHSWFASEGRLCSRDVLQPLDLILDAAASEKGAQERVPKPAREPAPPEPDADLAAQYPWLRGFTAATASKRKRAPSDTAPEVPGQSSLESPVDECEAVDKAAAAEDEAYNSLFEDLEDQRCAVHAAFDTLADQFRTSLLGGDWQLRRTGRLVYGVRVDVKAGSAVADLCSTYSLNKSASFEQSVYGDEYGQALGKVFIHRLSFLTQVWEDLGRPVNGIPEEKLLGYVLTPDLEASLAGATGRVQQRLKKILALAPKASASAKNDVLLFAAAPYAWEMLRVSPPWGWCKATSGSGGGGESVAWWGKTVVRVRFEVDFWAWAVTLGGKTRRVLRRRLRRAIRACLPWHFNGSRLRRPGPLRARTPPPPPVVFLGKICSRTPRRPMLQAASVVVQALTRTHLL